MQTLTPALKAFIATHTAEEAEKLLLAAARYPGIDIPFAVEQLTARRQVRDKLPAWHANHDIIYPSRLAAEQCSSEATARYKAELAIQTGEERHTMADLTGGFGIDCAFLSPLFGRTTYVERQKVLCETARHNFPLLGLHNIDIHHADSVEYLEQMEPVDLIFIDPARRDNHGGKIVAIGDCEPDVAALEPLLLEKARQVWVKLSPMLDIAQALHTLKHVQEAHVVSVANECKELLLVLSREAALPAERVPLHCANLQSGQPAFTFTRQAEQASPCPLAPAVRAYLYEPNASLLKAGAFRNLTTVYKVEKLHPNSHLYTSDHLVPDFPGRKFRVEGCCGFGKKEVARLLGPDRKANLTVRNFPATVAELRKRLRLSDGGDRYLFATTLADGQKVLIVCR